MHAQIYGSSIVFKPRHWLQTHGYVDTWNRFLKMKLPSWANMVMHYVVQELRVWKDTYINIEYIQTAES